MQQRVAENRLSIAYTLVVLVGAVASVTSGIAWGHWRQTLDQCVERNCSCILYAKHTPNYFLGGDLAPCVWVTFGPLFYVLFAIGFACFHGYRVLFSTKGPTTRTITTKNEAGETIIMQAIQTDDTSPLSKCFWITASVFTGIFTVYAVAHFSVFMDGYQTTCKQYRQTLINHLGVHGTVIPVVHGRLSCNAIFDFMDYMQPNSGLNYRDGFINTAAALIIGLIAALFGWVLFLFATYVNVKCARKKN